MRKWVDVVITQGTGRGSPQRVRVAYALTVWMRALLASGAVWGGGVRKSTLTAGATVSC